MEKLETNRKIYYWITWIFSKDEPHENYFQKDSLSNQLLSKLFQRIFQKQPSRGIFKNRCSENMHQIYRITPMRKCDFNKVALQCTIWAACFVCQKLKQFYGRNRLKLLLNFFTFSVSLNCHLKKTLSIIHNVLDLKLPLFYFDAWMLPQYTLFQN